MSTDQLTFAGLHLPAIDGPDPRHHPIREHVKALQLRTGVLPQWAGRDAKALAKWLKDNPSVSVETAMQLVTNKFLSDEPRGEAPFRWLPDLSRYAEGPLDRYRKLWRPDWRVGAEGIR